jgi:site-specific DNA-adenine methylase
MNMVRQEDYGYVRPRWVLYHFPEGYEKMEYLELFHRQRDVFFLKKKSEGETLNDPVGETINYYQQAVENTDELVSLLNWEKTARHDVAHMDEHIGDPLTDARRYLLRTFLRKDTEGDDLNYTVLRHKFVKWIENDLKRLRGDGGGHVHIPGQSPEELIACFNREDVFIYIDLPEGNHERLLEAVKDVKAKVLISSRDSQLYLGKALDDWDSYSFVYADEAGDKKREWLFANYDLVWADPDGVL